MSSISGNFALIRVVATMRARPLESMTHTIAHKLERLERFDNRVGPERSIGEIPRAASRGSCSASIRMIVSARAYPT